MSGVRSTKVGRLGTFLAHAIPRIRLSNAKVKVGGHVLSRHPPAPRDKTTRSSFLPSLERVLGVFIFFFSQEDI